MRKEEIQVLAQQVKDKLQTLPNYTLTSAKAIADSLNLQIEPDDVLMFMREILRFPHPYNHHYAHLNYKHNVWDDSSAFEEIVRVVRDDMVDTIFFERKVGKHKTESIEIHISEVEIRHYGENLEFLGGTIYPIPREDGISIMIEADQWNSEIPKPEPIHFENGVYKVPPTTIPEPLPDEVRWYLEFNDGSRFIRNVIWTNPHSPHADAIKDIVGRSLPDVAQYLF